MKISANKIIRSKENPRTLVIRIGFLKSPVHYWIGDFIFVVKLVSGLGDLLALSLCFI